MIDFRIVFASAISLSACVTPPLPPEPSPPFTLRIDDNGYKGAFAIRTVNQPGNDRFCGRVGEDGQSLDPFPPCPEVIEFGEVGLSRSYALQIASCGPAGSLIEVDEDGVASVKWKDALTSPMETRPYEIENNVLTFNTRTVQLDFPPELANPFTGAGIDRVKIWRGEVASPPYTVELPLGHAYYFTVFDPVAPNDTAAYTHFFLSDEGALPVKDACNSRSVRVERALSIAFRPD